MFNFVNKWFGGGFNARMIKQYQKTVKVINEYESKISVLSDADLANKTIEFKELLANGKTLDDILPEAFAVVREASKRVLGMRHFDVQLIGGIALHEGKIAEMRTGEGKTLVATSPVYLNALSGKGVHVVTVNDYLAKRDGEQMGQVYGFLGLTTSVIISGMSDFKKKEAYAADITYGTNHEFGFDYLRDNLKFRVEDMVMRPFNYALVDEVDSILIDEARTPLIISGPDDNASQMYVDINEVVKNITEEDYEKDEKTRAINLTEAGIAKIEKKLMDIGLIDSPLYDSSNVSIVYYVNCALKANKLFKKDVDYMVKNGQILIIDEFTGRAMEGRRYSEGLHQALEAKEGVEVQAESQTIASISYQNLFRMYPKLSGMTGTAMTEEAEFDEIYKLKVVTIPTNKPIMRKDHEDSIFLTMEEKDKAVVKLIKECYLKKQPVLVGTTNLDRSEYISFLLTKEGVKHNVLNAKQHEREAIIISEAGAPGAVTIATNMAGRGTDIKLGGSVETRIAIECKDIEDPIAREEKINQIKEEVKRKHDEVIKLGGLFVVGTERNESRRIDNQLRGRSGRQGDPGASKYFLSLEDDLIKRFGSPNLKNMLKKLGVKKDEDLTHRWISKAIEKAQQRVEAYNFDIRKHLLKYDDVMNEQRKMIYSQRLNLMKSEDLSEYIENIIFDTVDNLCETYTSPEAVPFEWKLEDLQKQLQHIFDIQIDINEIANDANMTYELLKQQLHDKVKEKFNEIKDSIDPEYLKEYEKNLTLRTLDNGWKKHLVTLEHLRRGINLQSYAQKNPLNEYKFSAFNIFDEMLNGVRKEIATNIMHLQGQEEQQFNAIDFDNDFSDFNFDDNEDASEKLKQLLAKWKQIEANNIPVHENNDLAEENNSNKLLDDNATQYNENDDEFKDYDPVEEDGDTDDTNEEHELFKNEQILQNTEDIDDNVKEQYTNYTSPIEYANIDNSIKQQFKLKQPSRNSLCPCGSGMKYKACHGKIQPILFNSSSTNNPEYNEIDEYNNTETIYNEENNVEIQNNDINEEQYGIDVDNINNITNDQENNNDYNLADNNTINVMESENESIEIDNEDEIDDQYNSNETESEYDRQTSNIESVCNNNVSMEGLQISNNITNDDDNYETPQEILRKFAKDQRDAIFGNISNDNNTDKVINNNNEEESNKIETNKLIPNSNKVVKKRKTKTRVINDNINTLQEDNIENNDIVSETNKRSRRKKKTNDINQINNIKKSEEDIIDETIKENELPIVNEIDNNISEEPITKKKVTRKKKKLSNAEEIILPEQISSKRIVENNINSEINANKETVIIASAEIDNNKSNTEVILKQKRTRVKKSENDSNTEQNKTKKITRTRKVKDNNIENISNDMEVANKKSTVNNNIDYTSDSNENINNKDILEKPKRGRKKTTKE